MSKNISQKQLEANRRNAQLSTGPKTPEGRERAKWNATNTVSWPNRSWSPTETKPIRSSRNSSTI